MNFFNKPETVEPKVEAGKEIQFKDPKTGELVWQRPLNNDQKKMIMDAMQKNAICAQVFMQLSRSLITAQERLIVENKNILASEKEIGDIVTKFRDEYKLDRRWGLNMNLGVLERRDPPGE